MSKKCQFSVTQTNSANRHVEAFSDLLISDLKVKYSLKFSRRSVLLGSVAVFAGLRGQQSGRFENDFYLVDGWVLTRADLESSSASSPLASLPSANAR